MAQNIETWFSSMGQITRLLLAYIVLSTGAVAFGALDPAYLAIYYPTLSSCIEIWRPFTSALFFGPFSFSWIMTVLLFVTYSSNNEIRGITNKPADFVFMLFLLTLTLGFIGGFIGIPWTGHSLILALCWIHCKRNTADRILFLGFECRSAYFPWVLVIFEFILAQSLLPNLLGVFVGHLYFFFKDILPSTHNYQLLNTPVWLVNLVFRAGLGVSSGSPSPVPPRSWGRGHVLGSQ
ncbi:unnamed protein product [Phytomonas sp. EM1]|nr:unnamed protein product [Phytomonas sp. EM1]|eukprot:CCW60839.1 unnamed protein product [Phytomonas sp. isolate EM1]